MTRITVQTNIVGAVSSVFSRTGVVAAANGDYTAAQVTNAADKSSGSQQSFTGEIRTPDLSLVGLTGATAASRCVGATTSGAPGSGTFLKGDWVIDQAGKRYTCVTAGSPGTWSQEPGIQSVLALNTYKPLNVGGIPSRTYTAGLTDNILAVTETAGLWVVTLAPAANLPPGFPVVIQDESGGAQANNITVVCQGSDLINGAAAFVIALNYGALDLSVNASQNGYYTSQAGATAAQGPIVIPPPPVITGV